MCLNHFYLCEVMSETPKLTKIFDFSFLKICTLKYFNYKKIKVDQSLQSLGNVPLEYIEELGFP